MRESTILRRTKHFLENPSRMITKLMVRYFPNLVPDRRFVEYIWGQKMDYPLDLSNPQTFNEKLQWLKLHDHNPLYTTLVDKVAVKQWAANRIGEKFVIPTLAVYDSVEDIDLEELPNRFVLKCNHDSGSIVICRDKSSFDLEVAKHKLGESMKQNYYWHGREWPYKNVKPKIMAEVYLEDEKLHDLPDFKFFCFDGEVKCLQVDYDRFVEHHRNLYDIKWNLLPVKLEYSSRADAVIEKPERLEEMLIIAEKLSKSIPHVRIDMYNVKGKIYFGEMTFFHGSGYEKFEPKEWDRIMGDWLDLKNY